MVSDGKKKKKKRGAVEENGSDGRTDRQIYVGNDVMDMWYQVEGSSTRRKHKQATEAASVHVVDWRV